MKKLLVLLFSLFFLFSSSVFADDISDFQIEGMSIGDSLLDYMTEDEILKEIAFNKDDYTHLNEPHKYVEVYIREVFPTYSAGLSVFVKNNTSNQYITNKNEKYIILFVRGKIDYVEDFDSCIAKSKEIADVLSKMFPNTKKEQREWAHAADPSGNSIMYDISLYFKSGDKARVVCSNYEETFRIKKNYTEGLSVAIQPKEISNWFSN